MHAVALRENEPQAQPHVQPWIGACSLLTAPAFAGLAFVLAWTMRAEASKLAWGRFAFDSVLIVTLCMLAVFLLMALWQWTWAINLIRDAFKTDPQRGYLLLSLLLFTSALVALLDVSMLHSVTLAGSVPGLMLAWIPAALAVVGSAVALSRARVNAFVWLGYLVFIPLVDVSIDTLRGTNLCGQTAIAVFNLAFMGQMQTPWVMVGFAMAAAAMVVAGIKAWRSGAVDVWTVVRAASFGLPLTAFALITLGAWASYTGMSACDGKQLHAFQHVFGAFYL